jgi:hypothetical protein
VRAPPPTPTASTPQGWSPASPAGEAEGGAGGGQEGWGAYGGRGRREGGGDDGEGEKVGGAGGGGEGGGGVSLWRGDGVVLGVPNVLDPVLGVLYVCCMLSRVNFYMFTIHTHTH